MMGNAPTRIPSADVLLGAIENRVSGRTEDSSASDRDGGVRATRRRPVRKYALSDAERARGAVARPWPLVCGK